MIIILWCATIIQLLLYIYLPIVGLYGIIRMVVQPEVIATICSPFLGIKKVSITIGFIIWMIQVMLLGVVLYDLEQWYRLGVNPLIKIW